MKKEKASARVQDLQSDLVTTVIFKETAACPTEPAEDFKRFRKRQLCPMGGFQRTIMFSSTRG